MRKETFKVFITILLLMSVTSVKGQTGTTEYKIQRGESIESIAKAHGVTVDDIIKANPNTDGLFYAGMKIIIPAKGSDVKSEEYKEHVSDKSTIVTNVPDVAEAPSGVRTVKEADKRLACHNLLYQSEAKEYGYAFSCGIYKSLLISFGFSSNLKFGKNELFNEAFFMGVGLGKHIMYNDAFYIQGKIYPYAGLSGYDVIELDKNYKMKKEFKDEFIYGANAEMSIGFKLLDTKKGNSTFLNLGYLVSANKFKTKDIIKNGMIMVGLTTIIN